jgi:hypothetical protein
MQMFDEKLLQEQSTARTLSYVEIDYLAKEAFKAVQRELSYEEMKGVRVNTNWFVLMRAVEYIHKSGGYFPSMCKYDKLDVEPSTPKGFGNIPNSPILLKLKSGSRDGGSTLGSPMAMERMESRLRAHVDEKHAAAHAEMQSVQKSIASMMDILSDLRSDSLIASTRKKAALTSV